MNSFTGSKLKGILLITILDKNKQQLKDDSEIVIGVGESSIKTNWNKAISIHKTIADLYKIDNRTYVKIKMLENYDDYQLDSVDVTIKDQFLTRRDQWYLCAHGLINKAVYPFKYVDYSRIRCRMKALYRKGNKVNSGIVSSQRKFWVYTKSSHTRILIEMTKEMYEYDENG